MKVEEAINAYLYGDVNTAINSLNKYLAKETYPESRVYYYLGLAYNDIGKETEAGKCFQKAIELEPNNSMYNYNMALIYSNMMLFHLAIPHLLITIKENPEHVRAHYILGTLYFKNGDMKSAADLFNTVTKVSPHYADGFYQLGNSMYYINELDKAEKALLKAVELNANHYSSYHKLALINILRKRGEEAVKYMQKSIDFGFDIESSVYDFAIKLVDIDKQRALDFLNDIKTKVGINLRLDNIDSKIELVKNL